MVWVCAWGRGNKNDKYGKVFVVWRGERICQITLPKHMFEQKLWFILLSFRVIQSHYPWIFFDSTWHPIQSFSFSFFYLLSQVRPPILHH